MKVKSLITSPLLQSNKTYEVENTLYSGYEELVGYEVSNGYLSFFVDATDCEEIKEEIKMTKTFTEVIRDIKEGEVWESEFFKIFIEFGCVKIYINNDKKFNSETLGIRIDLMDKFTLQRQQYTFVEAFEAYENGVEIESAFVEEGCHASIYKIKDGAHCQYLEEVKEWRKYKNGGFSISEIRNKWYINRQ